jgi:hypothetical protein
MAKASTRSRPARARSEPKGRANPPASAVKQQVTPKMRAQRKWVDQQKAEGRVQVSTWVPTKWAPSLKRFIQHLRDGKRPSQAFQLVFPKATKKIVAKATRQRRKKE